jgi:uncharacterized protein DUF3579
MRVIPHGPPVLHRNTGRGAPPDNRLVIPTPRVADPNTFFIEGRTRDGRAFRPSDWAERLAGAMSSFRPEGAPRNAGAFIGYSPYCVPRYLGGAKGVLVDERLREIEPMAWDFVMNFARDNELVVVADPEFGGT